MIQSDEKLSKKGDLMKKQLLTLILFSLMLATFATAATMTDPNGGEVFIDPTSIGINWSHSGAGTFDIQYSENNGGAWADVVIDHVTTSAMGTASIYTPLEQINTYNGAVEPYDEDTFYALTSCSGDMCVKMIDATDGSIDYTWTNTIGAGRGSGYHWGDMEYDGGDYLYALLPGATTGGGDYIRIVKLNATDLTFVAQAHLNTTDWGATSNSIHGAIIDDDIYFAFCKNNGTETWGGAVDVDTMAVSVNATSILTNYGCNPGITDMEADDTYLYMVDYNASQVSHIYKMDTAFAIQAVSPDIDVNDAVVKDNQIATADCEIYNTTDLTLLSARPAGCTACGDTGSFHRWHMCFVDSIDKGYARVWHPWRDSGTGTYFVTFDTSGAVIDTQYQYVHSYPGTDQSGDFAASNSYIFGIGTFTGTSANQVVVVPFGTPENNYTWPTSSLNASADYLLRIRDGTDSWDETDATFTIDRLTASNIVYPNGGELFTPGDNVVVNWSKSVGGVNAHYDLEYSSNAGGAWTPLATDYNYYGATETDPEWCSHQADGWYQIHGWDEIDGEVYLSKGVTIWKKNESTCAFPVHLTLTGSPCSSSTNHLGMGTFIDPITSDRKWILSCYSPSAIYQFNSTGAYEKAFGGCGGSFGGAGGIDCDDTHCYVACTVAGGRGIRKYYLNGTFIEEKTPPIQQTDSGGVAILDDNTIAYDSMIAGNYRYLNVLDWSSNTVTANSSVMTYPCPVGGYGSSDIFRLDNELYYWGRYCDGGTANNDGNSMIFEFGDPLYNWDTTGVPNSDQYLLRVRSQDDHITNSYDESDAVFQIRSFTPPTNPTMGYPNGYENITTYLLRTNWTQSTDADNDSIFYMLQYSDNSGVGYSEIDHNVTGVLFYDWDVTSLLEEPDYRVRVRACDVYNCSDWDESDDDWAIIRSPDTPTLLSPVATTYTTFGDDRLYINVTCVGTDPNGDNISFILYLNDDLLLNEENPSGSTVSAEGLVRESGTHTAKCTLFDGVYTSADTTVQFQANVPYTANDLPIIMIDFFGGVPAQFLLLGLMRLVQWGILVYVVGLGLYAGLQWVIKAIKGE